MTGPTRLSPPTEPATAETRSTLARISRVEVVVNLAAGSVAPDAPEEMARILAEFGFNPVIHTPAPDELRDRLKESVAAAPDLLIVLAGDGTARAAAELCGPKGPLVAPLPGGTMNMLPHAVYGERPWQEALQLALTEGRERDIGGGCLEGHRFLVAAVLGAPALWAPAREAARYGHLRLAWLRSRRAMSRAFKGRLRYSLDGRQRGKAEALALICPIASKVMHAEDPCLEAAALNPHGAGEALRLGLNALVRDWRIDPSVDDEFCRVAHVWSAQGIPAILDGESVRLPPVVEIRFDPCICRVLTPPKEDR